jgi:hypothetical protein
MTRPKRSSTAASPFTLEKLLWPFVAVFSAAIPLFVSFRGAETFREPKELIVRAAAIAVLAVAGIAIVWQPARWRELVLDRVTATAVAASAFVAVLAFATSTNRPLSARSIAYTFTLLVMFWAAYVAVRSRSVDKALLIGAAASVVNTLLAIAQRLDIYNPFDFPAEVPHRMRTTALIGNPNDVGASLAVCFIVILAYALVSRCWIFTAIAALLFAGVVASDALTAMIAIGLATVVMMFLVSRRAGFLALGALVPIALAVILVVPTLRVRMSAIAGAVRSRDYDTLTSHRVVGFLTAFKIFEDHPIAGAGPGTFKWLYLPYRIRVEADHPELYLKMLENLGEVHSDHLQVLAEEGLLGYAALLVGAGALASRSWKTNRKPDERSRFVRLAALPLAVCFVMLAAAGFPLELAAVMTPLLFFAACLFAWSHHDASA